MPIRDGQTSAWDGRERRQLFSTQWHDILPDHFWLNRELTKDRRGIEPSTIEPPFGDDPAERA